MAASMENMPESEILVSAVSGASLVKTRPVFGPESKCLFCCSESTIKVYSVESGECIRNLEGHTDTVTGIVINPNNKLQILSCSTDQTIIQWDYSDGILLRVYQLHHPLYHIDLLCRHEHTTLVLKRQISRQEFDIVECNLPTKKDGAPEIKTIFASISNKSNSMSVGCQKKVVAVIYENYLLVENQKKKKIRHTIDGTHLTCVAVHPTDLCIVTGCKNGRIYYWYDIFRKDKVVKTSYHWHALPVLDVYFTPGGSYLLSGGYECVLVKWQYNSHQRDFLPRLGAPINHVTCSHDNTLYATCHTDNVIQLITSNFNLKQVYQGLTCGYHVTQKTHPVPAGLHYEPRTKALVTNGKIGHLQFYSLANDKHLYNIDIVGQNYISPENVEKPLTVTEIIAADFSSNGDWLATVEMWDNKVMSQEIRLKFWKFKTETQSYTLNTTVEMPHNDTVTCVKIRPETGEEEDQPMAVTASKDGYYKTWTLVDDTNIYRQNTKWNCTFSGYYRGQLANVACYSEDGSLLCVGFGPVVTIWSPESNALLQMLANPKDKSDIKFIEFGKYGCSHLLVVCSINSLTTWNLSTCTVVWSVQIGSVSLVSDPETDIIAVISQNSSVYYFKPSSPDMLYKRDMISSCPVASAIFIPQTSDVKGRQLPTRSKLYYINSKHQLLSLSERDTKQTDKKNKITIAENLPQSALSLILSKDSSKQPVVEQKSSSKDVKSWKEFLDTPPQVQPAVTSLCQHFVQSMLVRSGDESVKEEEDMDSSDEESQMEVDEDVDSDDGKNVHNQTSKNKKSKLQKIKTEFPQIKTEPKIEKDKKTKSQTTDIVLIVNDMDWYKKRIQ